jgi:hypothetical protein
MDGRGDTVPLPHPLLMMETHVIRKRGGLAMTYHALLTVCYLNGLHGILAPKPVGMDGTGDPVILPRTRIMMETHVKPPKRGGLAMTYHVLLTVSNLNGLHGKLVPHHVTAERRHKPVALTYNLFMGELPVATYNRRETAIPNHAKLTAEGNVVDY